MRLEELRQLQNGPGTTEPWTAQVVALLAKVIRARTVIETGTYLGTTAAEIARMNPQATVYSVDTDSERTKSAEERFSGLENVFFINDDALSYLEGFSGAPDLVFIDDCHERQHVGAELEAILPKMLPGGIVCGHDVFPREHWNFADVWESHEAILLELPLQNVAGGLGVILT